MNAPACTSRPFHFDMCPSTCTRADTRNHHDRACRFSVHVPPPLCPALSLSLSAPPIAPSFDRESVFVYRTPSSARSSPLDLPIGTVAATHPPTPVAAHRQPPSSLIVSRRHAYCHCAVPSCRASIVSMGRRPGRGINYNG